MENLNLLGKSSEPSHKQSRTRKIVPTLAIACAALITCWAIMGKSGHIITSVEVPAFKAAEHLNPIVSEAERLVFVSHYLNRMIGTVAEDKSEFTNIADTWHRFLEFDSKSMSSSDAETAGEILAMMRAYQEMKTKRSMNDPSASMFWPRISTLMNFQDGSSLYSEGKDTPRATGKQLDFWTRAENSINKFRTPQWINQKGEIVASSGVLAKSENQETEYWRNAWGQDPLKDSEGNQLTTHHMIATQILNDHSLLNEAFSNKRILSDGGIPIDIAPIDESTAYAFKYLHLFESGRLGNNLTSEDQLFSRVVEKMISDWMINNHAGLVDKITGGVKKGWDATKNGVKKGWDATKNGASTIKNKVTGKKNKNHAGIKEFGKKVVQKGKELGNKIKNKFTGKKNKNHELEFATFVALHESEFKNHKGLFDWIKSKFGGKKPEEPPKSSGNQPVSSGKDKSLWDKVKNGVKKGWDVTKEGASSVKNKFTGGEKPKKPETTEGTSESSKDQTPKLHLITKQEMQLKAKQACIRKAFNEFTLCYRTAKTNTAKKSCFDTRNAALKACPKIPVQKKHLAPAKAKVEKV